MIKTRKKKNGEGAGRPSHAGTHHRLKYTEQSIDKKRRVPRKGTERLCSIRMSHWIVFPGALTL